MEANFLFKPDVLIITHGGIRGLALLGALEKLLEYKYLDNVNKIVGVSIGSAIGLFIAMEVDPIEIYEMIESFDISEFMNPSFKSFSLFTMDGIRKILEEKLKETYGLIPTLKQFYNFTGISFETVTSNITMVKPKYYNKDDDPNFSVVDAILMSMNIPIAFPPLEYEGNHYVDGVFYDSYPTEHYDDGKSKILVISLKNIHKQENNEMFYKNLDILNRMVSGMISLYQETAIKRSSDLCKHILIPIDSEINTFGIGVDKKQREKMRSIGSRTAFEFLKELNKEGSVDNYLESDEEVLDFSKEESNEE